MVIDSCTPQQINVPGNDRAFTKTNLKLQFNVSINPC